MESETTLKSIKEELLRIALLIGHQTGEMKKIALAVRAHVEVSAMGKDKTVQALDALHDMENAFDE